MTDSLIDKAFQSWANFMRDFASTKAMDNILNKVLVEDRKVFTVYPANNQVFRCFKECDYNNLKVVFLGLDPYINGEANGLAFSIDPTVPKVPPSLKNIFHELKNNYPEHTSDYALSSWSSQGILLLNTALTVIEKQTKSHWNEWKPFTQYIFTKLSQTNVGIVYVLLGKDAQEYAKFINPESNYILKYPHPAAEAYSGGNAGFFNSNLFIEINKIMQKLYNQQINF